MFADVDRRADHAHRLMAGPDHRRIGKDPTRISIGPRTELDFVGFAGVERARDFSETRWLSSG